MNNANLASYSLSYQNALNLYYHSVNSCLLCRQGLVLNTGQRGLYRVINYSIHLSITYRIHSQLYYWTHLTPPDPVQVEPVTPYLLLLEETFLP
jgi:hypothetical protein